MCGVAGLFVPGVNQPLWSRDVARSMSDAITHRGPDHGASWVSSTGETALSYRRLAILDLTPDGHQPMTTADGRLVLVFNGEIYNFVEIRKELEAQGRRFRGRSDTEVFLSAIERWGLSAALERAAGMFALAVWDNHERCLSLARDRAGKKPLYYVHQGDRFFFASEIKALKRVPDLSLTLDREALHHYLTLGYMLAPRTIYREVREVPAGSWMTIDAALARRTERYWDLPRVSRPAISRDEALAETERRVTLAVTQRMRADVPVGSFLSGGIDSGIITAIAAQQSSRPLKTFTVSFADGRFDEGPLASLVVNRYKTDHTNISLAPDMRDLLPRVVRAYDEPFADPSAVPTFAVAEAAGHEVKVVLNGEGADELFAGYRRTVAAWRTRHVWKAAAAMPGAKQAIEWLPFPTGFRTLYSFAYRTLRGVTEGPFDRYLIWSSDGFSEDEKRALYRNGLEMPTTGAALATELERIADRPDVEHFMAMDFLVSLEDCLLVKMDIATMAHSLEARSPFLDHRVIEWAASLPRCLLFSGQTTKPLLRALAGRYLPPQIVGAPKRGFEIPLIAWLRGPLAPMLEDLCLTRSGLIAELFDRRQVERFLRRELPLDEERWAKRAWILLMLAAWDELSHRTPTVQGELLSAR